MTSQVLIKMLDQFEQAWGERTNPSQHTHLQALADGWQVAADQAATKGPVPNYLEGMYSKTKQALGSMKEQLQLAQGIPRQSFDQCRIGNKAIAKLLVDSIDGAGVNFRDLESFRVVGSTILTASMQDNLYKESLAACENSLPRMLEKLLIDHHTLMLRLFNTACIEIKKEVKESAVQDNNKQSFAAMIHLGTSIQKAFSSAAAGSGSTNRPLGGHPAGRQVTPKVKCYFDKEFVLEVLTPKSWCIFHCKSLLGKGDPCSSNTCKHLHTTTLAQLQAEVGPFLAKHKKSSVIA